MSESTPESTPQAPPEAAPAPERRGPVVEPGPAPRGTDEESAVGFAVYDRTLRRYVGEVTSRKPSKSDAEKLAPGHAAAIVRV